MQSFTRINACKIRQHSYHVTVQLLLVNDGPKSWHWSSMGYPWWGGGKTGLLLIDILRRPPASRKYRVGPKSD